MCKILINRAKTISEVSNIECELEHLRSVLKMNDYRVNEFQKPGVYRILCKCGLVYIGETGRNLSLRLNCKKAELEKSALPKRSCTNDHRIKWNVVTILAMIIQSFTVK